MWLAELADLGRGFKKYFEVVPALTEELRDHAYAIRHFLVRPLYKVVADEIRAGLALARGEALERRPGFEAQR